MSGESVAPYVSEEANAEQELRALGLERARHFLLFMQGIAASPRRYRPYWSRSAFATFKGRTVYRKEQDDAFIIYVVETEKDGATRVTLIQAALNSDFEDKASILAVLLPRLRDFFR